MPDPRTVPFRRARGRHAPRSPQLARTWRSLPLFVALGILLASAVPAAAAVEPPPLTGAERDRFIAGARDVGGLTPEQIDLALADPEVTRGVLVEVQTSDVVEEPKLDPGGAIGAGTGCRTAGTYVDGLNVVRARLWRFRVDKYFCWNGSRVTSSQVTVSPTLTTLGTTTGWDWVGINSEFDRYYKLGASSYGGHHSYRQGRFKFCPPRAVCFQNKYPYVNVWGHHDGSYDITRGW